MFGGNQCCYYNINENNRPNNILHIQAQGTKDVIFTPITIEQVDLGNQRSSAKGMSISFQSSYISLSIEELRFIDYQVNKQQFKNSLHQMRGNNTQFQSNNNQGYNKNINNQGDSNHFISHNANAFPQHGGNSNNMFSMNNGNIGVNSGNSNWTVVNNSQQGMNNGANANVNHINFGMSSNTNTNMDSRYNQYNQGNNFNLNTNSNYNSFFSQETQSQKDQIPLQIQHTNAQNQFPMSNSNLYMMNQNANTNSNISKQINNNQQPFMNINLNDNQNTQNSNTQLLTNPIQNFQPIQQIPINQQAINQNQSQQCNNYQSNIFTYPIHSNNTLILNNNSNNPSTTPVGHNSNLSFQPQSFPSTASNNLNQSYPSQLPRPICQYSNKSPAINILPSNNTQQFQQPTNGIQKIKSNQQINPQIKNDRPTLSFESIANQIAASSSSLPPEMYCSAIIQDTTNHTYLNVLQNKMDDILIAVDNQLKQNEQLLKNSLSDKGINELNNYYAQYNSYYNQSPSSSCKQFEQVSNAIKVNKENKSNVVLDKYSNGINTHHYYKTNSYLKEIEELGNKACEVIGYQKPKRSIEISEFSIKEKENRDNDNMPSRTSSTSIHSKKIDTQLSFKSNQDKDNHKPNSLNEIYTLYLYFYLPLSHLNSSINKDNRIINSMLDKPQSVTVSNDLLIKSIKQLLADNLVSVIPFDININDIIFLNNNSELKDTDEELLIGSITTKDQLQYSFSNDVLNSLSSIEECEYPKTAQFGLSPSIEEMKSLSRYHLTHLSNFSIYNDYGRITFPGETNAIGIDIDSIVTIKPSVVTAYRTKEIPPLGHELNKKAIIEIRISPEDADEDINVFLQNLKAKVKELNAVFISYDSIEHLLRFQIDSFDSNYSKNKTEES